MPKALLKFTQLKGSFLEKANLREADLTCVNLASTLLARAVLDGAVLKRALMRSANLVGATLNGSDLRGADLVTAHLKAMSLQGARMGCLATGSGVRVCTDIRGSTALTCEQLMRATNWESAYRDDKMQCGGKIPVWTEAEIAYAVGTHAGAQQGEGRRA